MNKNRLEAFSDGVLAILITIMVLELRAPIGSSLDNLKPLIPVFLSYTLSFLYLAIYWNNHHHMLHTIKHITGGILWANMGVLFWLSLIPFTTAWIGINHFAPTPMAVYGIVLLFAAISYFILQNVIIAHHGRDSDLARAIGRDIKGKTSLALYSIAIPTAFYLPSLAGAIYVAVALMWLIPDRRIEKTLRAAND